MIKPSIKSITVKTLSNFLLALALVMLLVTGYNFRSLSIIAVENKAMALAEVVKSGLTSHMKAEVMDKRDYYLDEIRQVHRITGLQVIRGEAVTEQFGVSAAGEIEADETAAKVMQSKQTAFILDEFVWRPTMRVVIPYVAESNEALNCLGCHQVSEGEVLGAVDIQIDVSDYRNMSLMVLGGITLLACLFIILMVMNASRTIEQHVRKPLDRLVRHARQAYVSQKPVNVESFHSEEFARVAHEFNQFNAEIVAHQNELQDKNRQLELLNQEIEQTLQETVYTMGVIEAQRSHETSLHTRRVSLYCRLLAEELGLTEEQVRLVEAAAPLHDIGKMGIPDSILCKPDKLTEQERKVMQSHPSIGYGMLKHSTRPLLQAGAIIALHHHEKWDGSGYPQGLQGDNIHIFGRIVALADVFDALYSNRVYKSSWSLDKIIELVTEQRGRHFDPQLVDIFLLNSERFVQIYHQNHQPVDSSRSGATGEQLAAEAL